MLRKDGNIFFLQRELAYKPRQAPKNQDLGLKTQRWLP